MDIDAFLDKLEGVKRSGSGFSAQCPAHDDRQSSLMVHEGDEGILVKCFAGCETEAVLKGMGLGWRDLFATHGVDYSQPEAIYSYVDENGVELYQAIRFPGKKFRQRHMENGEWVWNLDGVRRVLYGLPEVLDAVAAGETVYVCEGEKDTQALRAEGETATCNPMGAGKWREEYSAALAGANVVIIAHRDEPGRAHAEAVKTALQGIAHSIWVVQAKTGNDAFDHLAAGFGVDDFVPLRARIRRGIITAREMADQALEDIELNEADVPGFVLAEAIPLTFRQGRMYSLGAATGDGKTSYAQQGARALCEQGKRGAYFSLEMPERDLRNRFLQHKGIPLLLLEEPWRLRMDAVRKELYFNGVEEIRSWNLDVVFETNMSATKIADIVRDRESEFVIVDHVHRFAWGERRRFEEEVLALTNIALEQNVMLLLLCQFRKHQRGRELEAFPRPTIQDFRETSQIADDSSISLAIWRQRDAAGMSYLGPTQAIVLKNRHTTGANDAAGKTFFPVFDPLRGIFTSGDLTSGIPITYDGHNPESGEGDDTEHDSWLPD